jgi:ABC-type nitrate/sulfonate/bicarbonate transport system substrate-binding protein
MARMKRIKVRGVYRSSSRLPIWTVMHETGIWEKAGIELEYFDYCAFPPDAEKALFDGNIDFISGDHLTPYGLVARAYGANASLILPWKEGTEGFITAGEIT